MSDESSRASDLLGIKPISESINKVTSAAVDASEAFLSRICLPAAEEIGLLLRDRVRGWRAANVASIIQKAEQKLAQPNASNDVHAHPRLVCGILEEGSWVEDVVVQDMWAGLLSSSCTDSGDDDSNLIFVNLLSALTKLQARVLKKACEKATKKVSPNGLITAENLSVEYHELVKMAGEKDLQRLDRELDYLRALELIWVGLGTGPEKRADVTPTPLALHMYVRCQGSRASPVEFFGLEVPASPEGGPAGAT